MATEATVPAPASKAASSPPPPTTPRYWRQLEMWASAVAVLSIAVAMATQGFDLFFGLIAGVWAVGAILMWRGGSRVAMSGTVVAFLPALLLGSFAVPGLFFQVTHPLSTFSVDGVTSAVLALGALLVFVSAIGAWIEGRVGALRSRGIPRTLGALAIAVFLVVLVQGAVVTATTPAEAARPGDTSLGIKDVKFSTGTLQSGSDVAIHIDNKDASFHTFTIDGHVDRTIAANGQGRVTLHLVPGTYHYYCAVPGHAETMHGTLTVR